MDRRAFISTVAGLLAAPRAVKAQPAGKVWRIGCLWSPPPVPADMDAFRQELRRLGHLEGRDLLIELRSAEGSLDRLPGLVSELMKLKVDVIVTIGPPAFAAAQKATSDIPIVFTFVFDPVGNLVRTLARPGGNITGVAALQSELTAKRLEFLKEALPSLKSVVILTEPLSDNATAQETQAAARGLGLEARIVSVRQPGDLEPAIAKVAQVRASAIVLVPDTLFYTYQAQIAKTATQAGVPVVGWTNRMVESGVFMSYAASTADVIQRAAYYVDRILKGAKAGDLPVEQPTKFDLVINLKTAKALGLTIPPSLLQRADQVIE